MKSLASWDRRRLSIGGLILAVVLFLSVHVFSTETLRGVQIDLTDERLYTRTDDALQLVTTGGTL
jgi:ABC-type uncharacterized transport system involved in gliding motility auxiliary subunit